MDVHGFRLERLVRRDQIVRVHSRRITSPKAHKLALEGCVLERITLRHQVTVSIVTCLSIGDPFKLRVL